MIIGFTGRIAAGKETLKDFLMEKGFEYLVASKLLEEELEQKGFAVTRKNMQDLGDSLREKHGPGVLMKMLLQKTNPNKNYIFDSLRNVREAEFLKENVKNFILIAVDAPQRLRFDRIIKRNKPSDPKTWEGFLEADNRDYFDPSNPMGQQVKLCMEAADYIITNDEDLEKSMNKIREIWEKIKEKTN